MTHHWLDITLRKPVWLYLLSPNKHTMLRANNSTPRNKCKRNDCLYPSKDIYKDVHSTFIIIAKNWEQYSLSTRKWITKLWYTYGGNKKKGHTSAVWNHMNTSPRHHTEQKQDANEYMLYDSTYIKFKHKQNSQMVTEIRIMISRGRMCLLEEGAGHILNGENVLF